MVYFCCKYYKQSGCEWVLEKEFSEVFAEFYVNFEAAKHLHPSLAMAALLRDYYVLSDICLTNLHLAMNSNYSI
jgi:hypothetical protein